MPIMKKFLKMHGLGNDFIILDCRDGIEISHMAAKELADRRTGIGCDQLMLIKKPLVGNDIFLEIRNSDGTLASACGNGTRCVADIILEETGKESVDIETMTGVLKAWRNDNDEFITVDMGHPNFLWDQIPLSQNIDNKFVDLGEMAPDKAFCLSMGNPHAVFFVDDLENYNLEKIGPILENHPLFPKKANISLASIISIDQIKMKIWERGAGITRACGSGACAVVVAAHSMSKANRSCEVLLEGGKLNVTISEEGSVFLNGPIEKTFEGIMNSRLSLLIE